MFRSCVVTTFVVTLKRPYPASAVFEWHEAKARSNLAKHGLSFENACRVFSDAFRLECVDRQSSTEVRFRTIGLVSSVVLVVVYTMRGEVIRIISAREAVRHEIRHYWQNAAAFL